MRDKQELERDEMQKERELRSEQEAIVAEKQSAQGTEREALVNQNA